MADLPDTKPLNQIILPGSHDSGMAIKATNPTPGCAASIANACTQSLLISEQLAAGCRWLDVRIAPKKTKTPGPAGLRCFHDTAFGEPLKQVADGIIQFLADHNTETVIVLLTKSDTAAYGEFLAELELYSSDFQGRLGELATPAHHQIAGLYLGDLRGRVVVAMDKPPKRTKSSKMVVKAKLNKWEAKKAFKEGDYRAWGTPDNAAKADSNQYSWILNTAGAYSNSSSSSTVRSRQAERATIIKNAWNNNRYWMNVYYTTNTSEIGLRLTSIEQADRDNWTETNRAAWRPVAIQAKVNSPVFNCVMMDFVSEERCQYVRTQASMTGW